MLLDHLKLLLVRRLQCADDHPAALALHDVGADLAHHQRIAEHVQIVVLDIVELADHQHDLLYLRMDHWISDVRQVECTSNRKAGSGREAVRINSSLNFISILCKPERIVRCLVVHCLSETFHCERVEIDRLGAGWIRDQIKTLADNSVSVHLIKKKKFVN